MKKPPLKPIKNINMKYKHEESGWAAEWKKIIGQPAGVAVFKREKFFNTYFRIKFNPHIINLKTRIKLQVIQQRVCVYKYIPPNIDNKFSL